MSDKILYIVHCVDTEGPLYESLTATFERLLATFGIKMDPSRKNLEKLRRGEGVAEDIRPLVMEFISADRMNYNTEWSQTGAMLDEMLSPKWRMRLKDDFGRGYVFNWFIVDHVGYIKSKNPRRRPLGYHTVFDYYRKKLKEYRCSEDEIHFHCHPVSFTREANRCSNNISSTDEHLQVLSRRLIDYGWFPAGFRPGQHTERADINLFLEMWIPFDFGNQAVGKEKIARQSRQRDLSGGRFGDWRRATTQWEVYHPDFYDYQVPGKMRRYIARCLNLNSRLSALDEYEIEEAFKRADSEKKTLMALTDHDEREMRPYIDDFYMKVRTIQKKYPGVKIKNSRATEAMREVLGLKKEKPIVFQVKLKGAVLDIKTDKPCWGPQPYFCFKTKKKEYFHENLDHQGPGHWSYTFDGNSIELDRLEAIALGTNDNYGNVSVWRKKL